MREEKAKETPSENTGQNRGGKKGVCGFFLFCLNLFFIFILSVPCHTV